MKIPAATFSRDSRASHLKLMKYQIHIGEGIQTPAVPTLLSRYLEHQIFGLELLYAVARESEFGSRSQKLGSLSVEELPSGLDSAIEHTLPSLDLDLITLGW